MLNCKMGTSSMVCQYKRNQKPIPETGCGYQGKCIYQEIPHEEVN